MFDITGNDIAALSDTDLRTLVARLCVAELRKNKLPASAVTAGGDQDAADGGLDVRVQLDQDAKVTDFIPRVNTVFQVKVPKMPRAAILKEMQPKRVIRPVIEELVKDGGAYIIVSSSDSTADKALRERRKAMTDAVAGIANADKLFVDFYDKERLATWVRLFPGIASWVQGRLGKPLQGWQPYGNWSAPNEPEDAGYLRDGKCRLHDGRSPRESGLTIEGGIERIRAVLSCPNGIVRLIGLSGLGKTRLVQALFDERVGGQALDPAEAIYTDMGDEPTPSPWDVIRNLVQSRQRAIVIVDNCQPTTHRSLVAACAATGSLMSLLTVEYDVGEDDPESTEVFRLEPASDDVIEQLIARREPHVSQVDRGRIAELSGGNARIALALARTVKRGESVSDLSDRELFSRLFHQGRAEDGGLLRAAEACSLVYSFDGETVDSGEAELPILAELGRLSVDELYRHIRELKARDLLQQRSKWRAVLPHALANKLARQALDGLIYERITAAFIERAPERLKKSFSRRLGYLHDCETAQKIVRNWLGAGGLLANIGTLGPLELDIFFNIAPVSPEAALNALELGLKEDGRAIITDLEHHGRYKIARLLRSLAFDATSFENAGLLLAEFAIAEPQNHKHNSTRDLFIGLFRLYLSGTHAQVMQRLNLIDNLFKADNPQSTECALSALDEMLEAWHFSSSHEFEFGARPRDFGWQPKTYKEISDWYHLVIQYILSLLKQSHPFGERLRGMLASSFRGLWTKAQVYDDLEIAVAQISAQQPWTEGWISVRETLRFDANEMPEHIVRRLRAIEDSLKPRDLLEEARAYAFTEAWRAFDLTDDDDKKPQTGASSRYSRVNDHTEALGRAVANVPDVLAALLPELSSGNKGERRWSFGIGLANGAVNPMNMWRILVGGLAAAPEDQRNIHVLRGFLSRMATLAPDRAATFLDDSISDPVLGPWFPILQCSVDIDERGVNRLLAAIQRGLAPVWRYGQLTIGRATDPIAPDKLRALLTSISALPGGYEVAVDVLHMKFFSMRDAGTPVDRALLECGRDLLRQIEFVKVKRNLDNELARIVDACLIGADAAECTEQICSAFASALSNYRASAYDYGSFLKSLFAAQPEIALTILLTGRRDGVTRWLMREVFSDRESPLDAVPLNVMVTWAAANPDERFPALANVIKLFAGGDDGDGAISPAALELLNASPDKMAVLAGYQDRFCPSCWSGSLAHILEKRRTAIQKLLGYPDQDVVNWAAECDAKLADWADRERARDRIIDESFE